MLLTVAWTLAIAGTALVMPSAVVSRVALFFHLGALVAGFGAVLMTDWNGLRWMYGRRSLSELLRVIVGAEPVIWASLAMLTGSGLLLHPNLGRPLTWVKLTLVLVVALNGLYANALHHRLHRLPPTARTISLGTLVRLAAVALISQIAWWGATLIGFLTTTSHS